MTPRNPRELDPLERHVLTRIALATPGLYVDQVDPQQARELEQRELIRRLSISGGRRHVLVATDAGKELLGWHD